MDRISELMDVPTEEQKRTSADNIVRTHVRKMEDTARAGMPVELLDLMKVELDGGNCPRCHQPWKEKVYDKKFGMGRYFKPDCRCYPFCEHCGRHLYREAVMDQLQKKIKSGRYVIRKQIQKLPKSLVTACPNCGLIMQVLETLEDDEADQVDSYMKQRNKGRKRKSA